MKKTLSITLYNRPKYTKTLLEHLDLCNNIDAYSIFIYCEPVNSEVIELAKKFKPQQTVVTINDHRYGCNRNIFQALDKGFILNDFHIHLEDDTIPAKDFLTYCEWCNLSYKDNHDVFSVSGYVNSNNRNEQFIEINNNYNFVSTRNWFTPWGWATWRNRWLYIRNFLKPFLDTYTISWDVILHKLIKNKKECFPMVSRIQNIGAENGSFCPGPEWHYKNQYNDYWIETSKQYQNNFIEIEKNNYET